MLTFELANRQHQKLLFEWTNDPVTRNASFNSNLIAWDEHVKWFSGKLSKPDCRIYIFNYNNVPCGMVRLEQVNNEVVIGVSVDQHFRGQGLAHQMISLATRKYAEEFNVKLVTAYIKHDNISSQRAFERANFRFLHDLILQQNLSKKYVYEVQ